MTVLITKKSGAGKQKKKLIEIIYAQSKTAGKVTGGFIRSENSLNQHIKLKHPEFWDKLKVAENQQQLEFNEFDQKDDKPTEEKSNDDVIF